MRFARSLNSMRPTVGDKRQAILRAAIQVFANGDVTSKVADSWRGRGGDGTGYPTSRERKDTPFHFDSTGEEAISEVESNSSK